MGRRLCTLARALLIAALALTFGGGSAIAHEERTPVIVDTDMALDDVRALALLASDDHVLLTSAIATEGASSVTAGAANLSWVLARLDLGAVPVARGRRAPGEPPPWREMSETLGFTRAVPRKPSRHDLPAPADALAAAFEEAAGAAPVYLCLGPATTLASLLEADPSLADRLGTVYYLGDPPAPHADAWNTERDPQALRQVIDSGVRIHFVWLSGNEAWMSYDERLLESLASLESPGAELISSLHDDPRVRRRIEAGHLKAWDETAALALLFPDRLDAEPLDAPKGARLVQRVDPRFVREQILALLGGPAEEPLPARESVVLSSYPVDPAMMRDDVAPLVPTLIERHGMEEWKATWLTNELHRHLGIYSILGAKMGIRARELLGASLDEVEVISEAGSDPPLACLNDGLQVATGASLGRGNIAIQSERQPRPAAEFRSGMHRVHLTLRDGVIERIRADIRQAIAEHGNLTPAYFARVRELALEYWVELDRRRIFAEQVH